jgi:hypothetical protein
VSDKEIRRCETCDQPAHGVESNCRACHDFEIHLAEYVKSAKGRGRLLRVLAGWDGWTWWPFDTKTEVQAPMIARMLRVPNDASGESLVNLILNHRYLVFENDVRVRNLDSYLFTLPLMPGMALEARIDDRLAAVELLVRTVTPEALV